MGAIVIIGGLAAVAVAFALWPLLRWRHAPMPDDPDGQAGELRQELEARCRALAELDEDLATGKLSRADHAQLRGEAEKAAASLLRRLEETESRMKSTSPGLAERGQPPSRFPPVTSLLERPLVLGGAAVTLLFLGLGLGVLLSRGWTSTPDLSLPRSASGARQAIRPDPGDVKAPLAYGHRALDQGQASEAVWACRQVLTVKPNNVEAITRTGLLRLQNGKVDQALAQPDRALSLDPRYAHALWDKAQILYHEKHDYDGTIKTLEAFLAQMPPGLDADRARTLIADAEARALPAKPTSTGSGGSPS